MYYCGGREAANCRSCWRCSSCGAYIDPEDVNGEKHSVTGPDGSLAGYCGPVLSETALQYRPIVYHYRQQFEPTWSMEYVVNYLGDPLPDLETATRAAYDWANSHRLFPLELE